MSLARSFTKRMKRPSNDAVPSTPTMSRSQSLRSPGFAIDRAKISAPIALVSTTNMLSYNAPDIVPVKTPSSSISTHSAEDSDHSSSTRSRASSHASRDTLTDASSVSSSSPTSPTPNHLTGYFAAANKNVRKSASSGNLQQLKEHVDEEPAVPAIPERALSHSKRAHERLAQKRSLQNMSRTRSSREHRASLDMFNASIQEETHPFGAELEQLNEVAEEFNGAARDAEMAADLAVIRERNLASFCAADYLAEIQPLFASRFGSVVQPAPMAWI
ncbi:hypothetical protein PMIN06_002949 [Paraphaeosphaeria minitans]|uniref:Uncharacterized protein n=1 Tax=Paraphaeosphaeria minitans TaxID=565426 RepID=A0A9P6GI63_9PLEO|nr:hypothetical protein PMIN01_06016 [Paraphaeosphaeria minitans]